MALTAEQLADEMYELVAKWAGQKKFKAQDLQKQMQRKHGEEECTRELCKQAIRLLTDNGRLVYTYFGGSFIEVPHKEAAEN